MNYPIVIHKDEDSDYGVSFPDLVGCVTAGKTIDEALLMAVESAEIYIEDILLSAETIPQPSTIEQCINDPEYAGGILWSFVTVDLTGVSGRTKRVNITVPERVLYMIDAHAAKSKLSRSAFLVTAAMERIAGGIGRG